MNEKKVESPEKTSLGNIFDEVERSLSRPGQPEAVASLGDIIDLYPDLIDLEFDNVQTAIVRAMLEDAVRGAARSREPSLSIVPVVNLLVQIAAARNNPQSPSPGVEAVADGTAQAARTAATPEVREYTPEDVPEDWRWISVRYKEGAGPGGGQREAMEVSDYLSAMGGNYIEGGVNYVRVNNLKPGEEYDHARVLKILHTLVDEHGMKIVGIE